MGMFYMNSSVKTQPAANFQKLFLPDLLTSNLLMHGSSRREKSEMRIYVSQGVEWWDKIGLNCKQLISYHPMSSIGLSGLSNISTDTLQTRYEKALKQINKLIEINRQLKENSTQNEQQLKNVSAEVAGMRQTNHELDEENNIMEAKYMELENHYRELETYCKKLEEELEASQHNAQRFEQHMHDQELKYHHDLELAAQKYDAIEKEYELLHQEYEQSQHTIQIYTQDKLNLEEHIEQLNTGISNLQQENLKLNETIKQKHIEELKAKLEQADNRIDKLITECNDLKSKQIDFEVLEEKQKVQRYIGISINGTELRQSEALKDLVQQYKKKINDLEKEKKDVYDKYRQLKAKMSKSPSKETYQRKIESLERLTQKQQQQIAKIIETYDRELNTIHKDNNQLRQNYYSITKKLTESNRELVHKEQYINELKFTTECMSMQNQSLRKVNNNLIGEKEHKLKDFMEIKDKISQAESITYMPKHEFNTFRKVEPDQTQPSNLPEGQNIKANREVEFTSPFETGKEQSHKIPISDRYNGNDDNFKFIQSVNILNGYNFNLGQNKERVTK